MFFPQGTWLPFRAWRHQTAFQPYCWGLFNSKNTNKKHKHGRTMTLNRRLFAVWKLKQEGTASVSAGKGGGVSVTQIFCHSACVPHLILRLHSWTKGQGRRRSWVPAPRVSERPGPFPQATGPRVTTGPRPREPGGLTTSPLHAGEQILLLCHFTDEGTEAQRGDVACTGHTAGKWQRWDLNTASPTLKFTRHYFSSKGWAFSFARPC